MAELETNFNEFFLTYTRTKLINGKLKIKVYKRNLFCIFVMHCLIVEMLWSTKPCRLAEVKLVQINRESKQRGHPRVLLH